MKGGLFSIFSKSFDHAKIARYRKHRVYLNSGFRIIAWIVTFLVVHVLTDLVKLNMYYILSVIFATGQTISI